MCEELWFKLKLFIKIIMDSEKHAELWDEIGPL